MPSLQALISASLFVSASSAMPFPEQFHLALAGDGEMRVSFKLNASAPQTCTYSWVGGANTTSAPSVVRSYFPGRGFYHHALLSQLPYSTLVTYACAGGPLFTFLSAPPTAAFTPFSMAVFGDWGYLGSKERGPSLPVGGLQTNWSATPVRVLMESLVKNNSVQLVLHAGDIGYQDDCFGEDLFMFCYENITDGWFNWIQNVSSVVPYHVSPGNHESECHSPVCILDLAGLGLHLNNFSAFKSRWAMNSERSGGVENMWYSVRRGGVHFVSLNTETDWDGAEESTTGDGHFPFLPAGGFGAPGQYLDWLAADLEKAAADPTVRWIIASGHRPFEDLPTAHMEALAALFLKSGVAIYFCGHGHTYIRYNASAFGAGAVQVMAGAAGSDETVYPPDQLSRAVGPASASRDAPARCREWCAGFDARFGGERSACRFCEGGPLGATPAAQTDILSLGVLDVGFEALSFKLLRAPDGAVIDTVVLAHK